VCEDGEEKKSVKKGRRSGARELMGRKLPKELFHGLGGERTGKGGRASISER